ncbi:unnamed protein product [Zymoseptoria tritici ST99CH_1E4]|uniref:Peptidase M24 domain-containing protein n=1 Tax=Zymoseptoria tritici ST99CH_1E4 TaxID=1276532 RepID=A0A2H1FX66_ZYMTR|nr:unnamed protein product [Zymoseptoria tritici ST99CH_1E4]
MEKAVLPLAHPHTQRKPGLDWKAKCLCFVATTALLILWASRSTYQLHNESTSLDPLDNFRKCSIDAYRATGMDFLKTADPPSLDEYVLRRDNLAKALAADNIDAFAVEPGYTFSYYANITQPQWEVWEPEERPFLMIVRPVTLADGNVVANTSRYPHNNIRGALLAPKVMVDEEMRDFIQRGLASNGFTIVGLGGEVEAVRQIKTDVELGILRAVNTGTVEAIRAMRTCLKPGLTENEVADVLDDTMRAAGMDPFFDIVEFGKSAALPHGGYDGSRKLEPGMFVLIDVGAHLYGYSSDVCRTFFPPFVANPPPEKYNVTEQLSVWQVVLDAQTAAVNAMVPNATAASVDLAARGVIGKAGYGKYFTHRLGHGIGIKAHESPYLNKGNFESRLRPGMVFTAEPGVYVLNEFGVRHEDILVVRENGIAENLSGGYATSPWEP